MAKWQLPAKQEGYGGWFQIVITKPGHLPVDVTFFRGVPTQLTSYSAADPFGDSTAVISFPQISAFDDPDSYDMFRWYGLFSNVDIYYVTAFSPSQYHVNPPPARWIDPITNQYDIVAPGGVFNAPGGPYDLRVKLWEGFVASIDYESSDNSQSISLQCQGALFQLDRYLQKPFYPPRPLPLETIIYDVFDVKQKPHLRVKPLKVQWPTGWTRTIPRRNKSTNPVYFVDGKAGSRWTGYADRQTGSWERCLTGFVQDKLSLMIVKSGSGGPTGSQWTVNQMRGTSGTTGISGRQPVLLVRDNNRAPDITYWVGTPGVTCTFSTDGTQMANIAYGDGTSIDGTTWRNAVISNDGSRTDYQPLAWINEVYPYVGNSHFSSQPFVAEAYMKFGAGFDQAQATSSAQTQLRRDLDPGFTGNMTVSVDPSPTFSRWTIRAGMTVLVKGLAGLGSAGQRFHITEVNASPLDGTVSLTLDSRYRDLLTTQESIARTRDPLTPTRMLQINRTSVTIDDLSAPWDYHAGSGYIPKASTAWWAHKPSTTAFPYVSMFKKYPPKHYPQWYTKVNANASTRAGRWTRVPILTSEKGTIRRTEIICLDVNGNILKNPFHASVYYIRVTPQAMPRDKYGPSPYINNSFTTINPATGNPWPPGNFYAPEPSYIIGWGGRVAGAYDRAGFYPGSETQGSPVSGIFVDENTWDYDNTSGTNQNWNPNATVGQKQTASAITLYMMLYAEYKQPVYFYGRIWRQEPGSS